MEHQNSDGVVVVMVPLPAQGHLNQLLHLTRLVSTRGVPVHYVGFATHNRQAKDRVHGWDAASDGISNIHFHDFQLPQVITPPVDYPVSDDLFPTHLLPTFEASLHLREPLGALLRELAGTHRRVVVVHDSLTAFAAEEASLVKNTEAYSFVACSAFAVLRFVWEAYGKPADEEGRLLPVDIPRVSFENTLPEGIQKFIASNSQWLHLCAGTIYDTCRAVEGRFLDLVAQQQPDKKLWEMGPFNPVSLESSVGTTGRHACLEWLDKQPARSVIYVSFGTTTSMSNEQITEIAFGLERSGQRFLWVLRDADRGDIYEGEARKARVPDGFEERVQGVGMVVRDWAPQLQILAHSSTGGFMSHCGWNSSTESLSMGVPIAAWPMHSDQPNNALLLTEVLKVGLMVREWSRRAEVISSDDIESSVRKLMASDEGDMMRKRAEELGINVRQAVSENGSSTAQLESFLTHISR